MGSLALRGVQSLPRRHKSSTKGGSVTNEQPTKPKARRRGKPIEVWVNDEEKELIKARAAEAGLSRSGYLRAVGLNYPIRSIVDLVAVADLAKVNGDLGRVAGLLKLWLSEKNGKGSNAIDVQEMMNDFRILQAIVREKMGLIVRANK
jgi:hypothetical protein